jgi:Zn-dependent M28 family amino/carboxypeptidase
MAMPGKSFDGPPPPWSPEEKLLAGTLRDDVTVLAQAIGNRNWDSHPQLERAAEYLEKRLGTTGQAVRRQTYTVDGRPYHNLEIEIPGASRSSELVIVGAHYDSVAGCPGANDNATGTASLLALAGHFANAGLPRTLRFVAFTNEEPPFFQTSDMGSLVYARRCRQRNEAVSAMISLETMGCYSGADGSQRYPPPLGFFYPSKGNFIGFVGNVGSRRLVKRAIGVFRQHSHFPSEGAAMPGGLPGIGWSDQWSFWKEGYPAIMVTDTAPFRYAHYHTAQDTVDKVDFESLARVTLGLVPVVEDLARSWT